MTMKMQLQTLRKGTISMANYFAKMKRLADNLALARETVELNDFVQHVLTGSDSLDYKSLATIVLARGDKISLDEFYSLMLSYVNRVEQKKDKVTGDVVHNMSTNVALKNQNAGSNIGGYQSNFGNMAIILVMEILILEVAKDKMLMVVYSILSVKFSLQWDIELINAKIDIILLSHHKRIMLEEGFIRASDLVKVNIREVLLILFVHNGGIRLFNGYGSSFGSYFAGGFPLPKGSVYQGNMAYSNLAAFFAYNLIFPIVVYPMDSGNSFGSHGFFSPSSASPAASYTSQAPSSVAYS